MADYVAEVLTEYSKMERSQCVLPGQESNLEYFFEMLAALRTADDRTSFCIRAHIGNYSLFLSGIFLNRIRYRAEHRGFPDLSYYESLGQSNFKLVCDHRLAARHELSPIYSVLARRFQETRLALNDLSERVLSVGDGSQNWAQILRM